MPEDPQSASPRADTSPWRWLVDIGAMGQAAITGAYAWVVSVVPFAWGHGAGTIPKIPASLAILSLVVGVASERLGRARFGINPAVLWGFVISCLLTWISSASVMALVGHMNVTHGIASILGWALFAHACSAPAIAKAAVVRTEPIPPRVHPKSLLRAKFEGSSWVVVFVSLGALALQALGWQPVQRERAVLIRVISLAAGVVLISAAAMVVSGRSSGRTNESARTPILGFALLLALVVGGVYWLR